MMKRFENVKRVVMQFFAPKLALADNGFDGVMRWSKTISSK